MKRRRYKKRKHPEGWGAFEEACRAIESLPPPEYPQLAHAYHSIRNRAIKRYIWTGEPEAIDDI